MGAQIKRQFQLHPHSFAWVMTCRQSSFYLVIVPRSGLICKRAQLEKIWNQFEMRPHLLELWDASCFNPQLFPVCNLPPIVITRHFFNFSYFNFLYYFFFFQFLIFQFSIFSIFQSPIVSSLQFAGDRDYLHATFSIGRKFIYVFAAKISIDSLVDPREFVCKRLMDLPRELGLLYTS